MPRLIAPPDSAAARDCGYAARYVFRNCWPRLLAHRRAREEGTVPARCGDIGARARRAPPQYPPSRIHPSALCGHDDL
jgi:hypothetical protein